MSKSAKNSRPASRPPVDALQYEKLALSAFDLIERQKGQLDKLITFVASIYRSPAVTHDERQHQRTLLGLLIDTVEDYQREVEVDRELYRVIALDAKGISQTRLTARHATKLLTKASKKASNGRERIGAAGVMQCKHIRFKTTQRRTATAH
ncbi:hypothetical protein A6V36_31185 [Paraburkholderia ginsengiterrae]|uniref:Uncharacterized protein n=1 Tax=Paraburkholderia ginsengiterrae TaxID=1462993 RepID=A0A1A9MXV0_9BURK|nr:hypothetical protein [Paraburkholderia ginsengiterrae]OAJ51440.1 hypothetical protein A6V37_12070 [Paraburkholderia ginsengiterrae]OAJ57699.1 hypothetical protein A6V36_31185 [Paraburkholderia ginsengiterrae]